MTINSQPTNPDDVEKARGSNVVIGILVAVILGLVVLVAVLFLRDDDAAEPVAGATTTSTSTTQPAEISTTVVGDTPTTTVAETTTTAVADSTTTTTAAPVDEPTPAEQAAQAAADAWIQAVTAGDDEAAWELLAEESRVGIGGREGLEESLISLGEDYAPWVDPGFLITYASTLDDETVIVTYLSSTDVDGTTIVASTGIPVVVDDSLEAKVSPFVGSEPLIWVNPDPLFVPATIDDPDPTLRALVPDQANLVMMFVNGEPAADMVVEPFDDFTRQVSGRAASILEVGGLYVVTVVYTVDVDRLIHVETAPFVILEDSQ